MEQEFAIEEDKQEIMELESLITDGVDAKIPIEIEYNGNKFGACIRPLTTIEWNNATQKALKFKDTNNEVEILKIGLYNLNGSKFPANLIEKLPAGISNKIMKEIARVSGVSFNNEENIQLMKEIMGF